MFTVRVIRQPKGDLPTVNNKVSFIERGMQVDHIEVKDDGSIQVTMSSDFSLGKDDFSEVEDWVRPVVQTTTEEK